MAKAQKKKALGSWILDYHIATVATLTPEQATLLKGLDVEKCDLDWWGDLEPRKLNVILDYPLEKPVGFIVFPDDYVAGYPRIGLFLLTVAKMYERIYEDPKRYGVLAHTFTELYFERVTVFPNGDVEFFIGSV